jgi:diguanylate cyclase (GGDEF)-like protein/PAS domain S-box-containing protein
MAAKYPILDHISISPELMGSWQEITNIIAQILNVPAALIMRVHEKDIEVLLRSNNKDNVYEAGERAYLDTGLYCETVLDTRKELLVVNALKDPAWDHNPDIKLGMISYYGMPLIWPSGELFGTLCVLDSEENSYSDKYLKLMKRFRENVQLNIDVLYDNYLKEHESTGAKKQISLLSHVVEQIPVAVLITDPEANIEFVNHAFELTTGYHAAEVVGKTPRILQSGNTSPGLYMDMWQALTKKKSWKGELQNLRKNGEIYWERLHIAPVLDDPGEIQHYVAVQEDITYQKEQEARLVRQAFYDPLTGLPNRSLVHDRLEQLLVEARRSDCKVAVLFLDLDDFKKVNDSLGHEEGDKLLVQAAHRLQNSVRESDTVGRLGGDEFVILVGNLARGSDAQPVANHLLEQFRYAFKSNGRDLLLTASIGIAVYPNDGSAPSQLLRHADSAMYYSKGVGRNTYSYFTHAMNREVTRRMVLEEQLHGAVERGEFSILYQPKIEVTSGKIIGVEALLRWHNPTLGGVSPSEFIPLAEQNGLIINIGRYVLSETIADAVQWKASSGQPISLAVNLSPRQFRDPTLVVSLQKLLEQAKLPASILELEITEGVLMSGHIHVDEAIGKLSDLGITIAMDDFGTGYSSLSYLRQYPFNVLKIDRSFIADLTSDQAERELIIAAIAMAHGLGLKVVAEGVETREQLAMLSEYSCDIAQGFFFSEPVSADEIAVMLQ